MARTFRSFRALAAFFHARANHVDRAIASELDHVGAQIANDAKALFGTYQPGWAQLKDETQDRRRRMGYAPNEPLLMIGALRGEVKHHAGLLRLFVGVRAGKILTAPGRSRGIDAAELMNLHERGNIKGSLPARPVFGIVVHGIARQMHAFGLGVCVRVFA